MWGKKKDKPGKAKPEARSINPSLLAIAAAGAAASPAQADVFDGVATYVFVGSWRVSDGPHWTTNPPVYSGREAAAFLFGGAPTDYAISTLGSNPALINFSAFYDGWGDNQYMTNPQSQDFRVDIGAPGYNSNPGFASAYSAYVADHVNFSAINYAFELSLTNICPGTAGADTCNVDSDTTFSGQTDGLGGTDTIALGGTVDFTFNGNTLGNEFVNYERLTKSGSSVATLTGLPESIQEVEPLNNGGVLRLAGGNAISDTARILMHSNVTLAIADDETVGSIQGTGGDIDMNDHTFTVGGNNLDTSYGGLIRGDTGIGRLRKVGTGELTLSFNNTYSGGTLLEGGSLRVLHNNALGTAGVTMSAGTTIDYGAGITLSNPITLLGQASLNVDAGSAAQNGAISGIGFGIDKTGAGTLTLGGANTFTGPTNIQGGSLIVTTDAGLSDSTAVTISPGANLTIQSDQRIGSLAGDGTVSLGANTLFTGGDGSSTNYAGVIDGTGGLTKEGAGNMTLAGVNTYSGATNVNAGTLTLAGGSAIDNNGVVNVAAGATLALNNSETVGSVAGAGDIALGLNVLTTGGNNASTEVSGNISGAGAIIKNGTGVFTLAGVNTHGATYINSGVVALDGGDAIGDASLVQVNSAGTLELLDSETIGTLQGVGAVDLNANTLTVADGNFSGDIGGTGGLNKVGAGTLVLSGTNTYGGLTDVQGGTLLIGNGQAIADAGAVNIAAGATLDVGSSETIGSLAGAGTVQLNGLSLTTGGNDASTTFSGDILGGGALTKEGAGVFTLSGANAHVATFINDGVLEAAGGAALLDTGVVQIAAPATLRLLNSEAIGTLLGSGALELNANTVTITDGAFSGVISGAGGVDKTTGGALLLSGANTFLGPLHIQAGAVNVQGTQAIADAVAVTVDAGAALNLVDSERVGSIAGAGTIDLGANTLLAGGNNSDTAFSGLITGAGALWKEGTGELTLSGANDYAGGTVIAGGTIRVENDSALGTGSLTTLGSVIDYADGVTIANPIVLMSDPDLNVDVGIAEQSGDISESGGVHGVQKTGAGELILSGTNTYTGLTDVQEGTLALAGGAALDDGGAVNIAAAATLRLDASETLGGVSGAGDLELGANTATLTGASDFDGLISGEGGLDIELAATVELHGANTFEGGIVNDGLLALHEEGAAGTGAIANEGILFFSDNLGNDVSGAGGIVKFDPTFAELTGANTYTGGTLVGEGTLRAGLANIGTGALDIFSGARFELNQSTDATLANAVTGASGSVFAQIGSATITYGGEQFGAFDVEDGTAHLAGNITALNGVTIFTGASLTGVGTITGNVVNNGTISPGNSPGTINIAGNYTHNAPATLTIEFNGASQIDLLNVSGTATINGGTLELVSLGGADGTGLTFLAAAGGVSGEFDSIVVPFGGAGSVIYNPNNAQIGATLITARPSTANSQLTLAGHALGGFVDVIGEEVESARGDGIVWARALFGEIDREEADGSLGYSYENNGVAGGVRTRRHQGFAVGAAIASTEGEAELALNAGDTTAESLQGAVFADWRGERWAASVGATLGGHDFETRRRVLLNGVPTDLSADTSAETAGLFASVARHFSANGWEMSLSARAAWLSTNVDGYREAGSSVLRLDVDDFSAETARLGARFRAERRFNAGEGVVMAPSITLGVVHEAALNDREAEAVFVSTGDPVTLALDDQNRTLGEAQLGMTWYLGERFDVSLTGSLAGGDGDEASGASIGARFRF
ncbi:MAG: autotransporter-associated beta strand repeat-containing protein [Hyphomonadaceae bacterium]